jgi:NADH-quinone oxidoreductase subunit E
MAVTSWLEPVEKILTERGENRASLLPCLEGIQKDCGFIPHDSVVYLRDRLLIPSVDIYGVISFYGMLTTTIQGKYVIRLCDSLPCYLNHSENMLQILENELGIKSGETTPDKKFTLEIVPCLGLCDKAPAMMVNENIHGKLTRGKIKTIINSLED